MANQGGDQGPARLLVVDDQELYREGLIGLIGHWKDFEVIGDAASGAEAVQRARELKPDVVLMDLQMPGMNGIEATAQIHLEMPDVRIIILTVSVDEDALFACFREGATGYVLKDTSSDQLHSNLRAAVNGDVVLSGRMGERIVKRLAASQAQMGARRAHPTDAMGAELTEREIELLCLVAQGLSNDEIGAQMYVSFGTVKKSLQALMRKLQLPNRVMLAVYAVKAGLLDQDSM